MDDNDLIDLTNGVFISETRHLTTQVNLRWYIEEGATPNPFRIRDACQTFESIAVHCYIRRPPSRASETSVSWPPTMEVTTEKEDEIRLTNSFENHEENRLRNIHDDSFAHSRPVRSWVPTHYMVKKPWYVGDRIFISSTLLTFAQA